MRHVWYLLQPVMQDTGKKREEMPLHVHAVQSVPTRGRPLLLPHVHAVHLPCHVLSHRAKDLIRKLLIVDHHRRLSAAECLKHPWVTAGQVSSDPLTEARSKMKVSMGVGLYNALPLRLAVKT